MHWLLYSMLDTSFSNILRSEPLSSYGTSELNKSDQNGDTLAVAVIVGYYNGNKYLPEQVQSILAQSHQNLEVFISDDGSKVAVDIDALDLMPEDRRRVRVAMRPARVGFTANFLGALSSIDSYDYFAFSDQDDIWYSDKITRALEILSEYPEGRPSLYCARTAVYNEDCNIRLGVSPLFQKPASFANALVQNIGGGNTMVFNRVARDLIVRSARGVEVVSHDWWSYQIVSGAGGIVYYDPEPCLRYRQHACNLVGSNQGWAARLIRIQGLLKGRFQAWNDVNIKALSECRDLLAPENQRCLDDFVLARQSGLFKRLVMCVRSGVYRQTWLGNLALWFGFVINKV